MEARALRGIDLSFYPEEIHGLVGESGSGKTVTSTCIMDFCPLLRGKSPRDASSSTGPICSAFPRPRCGATGAEKIAMVFQEPSKYLNPAFKIGGADHRNAHPSPEYEQRGGQKK
jgi:ABC-type dipeptide/oligopeptide/nickel transport system ATPase component